MATRYPLVRTATSPLRQPRTNDSKLAKRLVSLPVVTFEDTTAPLFTNFVPADGYVDAIVSTDMVFDIIDTQSGVDTNTIYIAVNSDWVVQAGVAADGYAFSTTPIQSGFVIIGEQATLTFPQELEEFSSYSFDGYATDVFLNQGEGHWSFFTGSRFDVPSTLFTEQYVADNIEWDAVTIPTIDFDAAEDTFSESYNVTTGPTPSYPSDSGFWPLDDTVIDQASPTSTLLDGTMVGSPSFAAGVTANGRGISLNGSGQYVTLPTFVGSSLNLATRISLSCWVKPTTLFQTRTIWELRRGDGSNNHLMLLRIDGSGNIVYNTRPNALDTQIQVSAGNAPDGVWTHIVIVQRHKFWGDDVRIFVNGQLAIDSNQTFSERSDGSCNAAFIGHDANSPGQDFAGVIDEVKFFRRDLTTIEIGQLYQWRDWEGTSTPTEGFNVAEDTFTEQFIVPPWAV